MIRDQALALLDHLLAPLTADRFFADYLGQRPLSLSGAADHPRTLLLGHDPQATILAAWATHPALFGFHADGVTGPPPSREGVDGPEAFAALVAEHHARGYTIHLPDLAPLSAPLTELLRAIEALTHQPAKASLFWSRPGNRAPVHYDHRDNITIQLVGAKRWHLSTDLPSLHNAWSDVAEKPTLLHAPEVIDATPGHLLFIPRGLSHTVETLEESLHLSITLMPITVREAIIAALDHLSDYDRTLRQTALGRVDRLGADLPAIKAQLVDGLERLLAQCRSPGFVGSALQRRSSRIIGELPRLPPSPPLAALQDDQWLAHAPGAISTMLATPDMIDWAQPGHHLYIHRAAEPALRFIAATPRFRVGDVPGLAPELRDAVIQRLLESGFLATA
jgi:hypothetical protein